MTTAAALACCVDIGGQCRCRHRCPDVALSLTCSRQFKFIVPAVSSRRAFKSPLVVSAARVVYYCYFFYATFILCFIIIILFVYSSPSSISTVLCFRLAAVFRYTRQVQVLVFITYNHPSSRSRATSLRGMRQFYGKQNECRFFFFLYVKKKKKGFVMYTVMRPKAYEVTLLYNTKQIK